MSHGLDKIPDAIGHMVLAEDGVVISSGGDMSNDEQLADKLTKLVHNAYRAHLSNANISKNSNFRRLTVIWDDFVYVMTISNHKIFVAKRRIVPTEAVVA
jgi:hypothetical protein